MGSIDWTDRQKDVFNKKDGNILVSAAAGSGKTAVLVERIYRKITDPDNGVDIDRLLVVTFTKAAASEMKEKIRKRLEKASIENPGDENIRRQLALINNAQISTIDSFANKVVTENFDKIDLDPNYRMIEDGEQAMLLEDSLNEVIEKRFEEADDDFISYMEYICGSKVENKKIYENYIEPIKKMASRQIEPYKWLEKVKGKNKFDTIQDFEESDIYKTIMDKLNPIIESISVDLDKAERISISNDYGKLIEKIEKIKGYFDGVKSAKNLNEIYDAVKDFTMQRSFPKNEEEDFLTGKALISNCIVNIKNIKNETKISEEKIIEAVNKNQKNADMLIDLTYETMKVYDKKKKNINVVEFDDISRYALKILCNFDEDEKASKTDIAKEMASNFDEVMIDEYQDSNKVQELILDAVSYGNGENNRFMVGDVKQSIYKFRQAEPQIFLDKYNEYEDDVKSSKSRIILDKNFRSRKEIINSVNNVFNFIMYKDLGGIDYADENNLEYGSEYIDLEQNNKTELCLLDKNNYPELKDEARFIGCKIKNMMANGNFVKTEKDLTDRALQYKDIAILFRGGKDKMEDFAGVLEYMGIPVWVEKETGFFDTIEINTMIDLFKVIDNPLQDVPLVTVMKSPIFNFDDEELSKIKIGGGKVNTFYDAVEHYREKGSNQTLKDKANRFINQINKYKKKAVYLSIHELLNEILEETNYFYYISALPNGSRKVKNIEELKEWAVSYEKTNYKGIFNFVRFIKYYRDLGQQKGEETGVTEEDNVVRVMTMHKSKGLEYPVVFIPDIDKGKSRDKDSIKVDDDGNISTKVFDITKRTKSDSILKKMIVDKHKEEDQAEEIRILYVAMTRAKEKLIITGRTDLENLYIKQFMNFDESLMPKEKLCTANYLTMLGASLANDDRVLNAEHVLEMETKKDDTDSKDNVEINLDDVDIHFYFDFSELEVDSLEVDVNTLELIKKITHKGISKNSKEILDENLSYVYPNLSDVYLPSKMSVTEIKMRSNMYEEDEDAYVLFDKDASNIDFVKPKFIDDKEIELKGAERGTTYHKVFELIDFSKDYENENTVCKILDGYLEDGTFSEAERDCIEPKKLVEFAKTDLYRRMKEADSRGELYRERAFLMKIPYSDVDKNTDSKESIVVQGIIDVCFIEDGKFVIADYKTDNVDAMEDLVSKYKVQLEKYQEAIELISKIDVSEKIIYSVKHSDEITI